MIVETANFVSEEEINTIKSLITEYRLYNPDTHTDRFYNREGMTVDISGCAGLQQLDALLSNIFDRYHTQVLAEKYRPAYPSGDSGYEYHVYRPGEVCKPHVDSEIPAIKTGQSILRYASVVLHLNTVEDGGELVFPAQQVRIKTEAGKIVAFPPYGTHGHYVTKATSLREVIVTWFIYPGLTVVKNAM